MRPHAVRLPASMPLLAVTLLLALTLPSRALANEGWRDLATFDDVLPGTVIASTQGAALASCSAADLAGATADATPIFELSPGPAALEASGGGMLVLGTSPATGPGSGPDNVAQVRWSFPFSASEPSRLSLRLAFTTSDRPDFGDWFLILLDGERVLCGDARTQSFPLSGGMAPGDRSSGWLHQHVDIEPGQHVLEAIIGDGTDSTGGSSLSLDDVRIRPIASGQICQPAPPEDVGEIPYPWNNPKRWIFDDNRFCSAGPSLSCSRCLSGSTGPCQPDDPQVDPNQDAATDSTGLSFEMYVVADCGTEMHVPLDDVESGCISVFDQARNPIAIHVENEDGSFSMNGGEVCWTAEDCSGGGFNDPGGPGNAQTMDVSFQGNPTLCGIYILNFRSWAGCIWDLFANCDGTTNERFNIYDDFCEANFAVSLLPEVIVESLTARDGGGCTVEYCATVRNIGCRDADTFVLHVANSGGADDEVITLLAPGERRILCGSLPVLGMGPAVPTLVTATVDWLSTLAECSESPNASSCDPLVGANSITRGALIECEQAPTCDAGGPYVQQCAGNGGPVLIQLDGTGSSDPENEPISFLWTTTCQGASFDDPTSPAPVLSVPPGCRTCLVSLRVTDPGGNFDECSTSITIEDSVPPSLQGLPADTSAPCNAIPPVPTVTAIDACDPAPQISFLETRTDLICQDEYRLIRTWTATDSCGNSLQRAQVILVVNQPPTITGIAPTISAECPNIPPVPTPTVTDDCDPAPSVVFTESSQAGPCLNTSVITREWVATDRCGRTATAVQVVTIVDTIAPTLVGVPPDVTAECLAPSPATVTATDSCDPAPGVTFNETRTNGSCPQRFTLRRTWTATDACGNSASRTQSIAVDDTLPPTLVGVPADVTAECLAPSPATVTATDSCDPAPGVTFSETRTNGSCPQRFTLRRTWTATDACGNSASRTQVITVNDTIAPTLVGVPADVTAECLAPLPATVTATDSCDPAPVVTFNETRIPGPCPQSFTLRRTWTATDACGNSASRTQVITVNDTIAPTLVGVPPDVTAECLAPSPASVTATDSCDPNPSVFFLEQRLAGPCPQAFTLRRTWSATDACGNSASRGQLVTVVDTLAPAVLGVPADATVECDAVPAPAPVSATDSCDPIPLLAFAEQRVNGPCPNQYQLRRTWTATDHCGNSSSRTQVLSVVDTIPPIVAPPAALSVECPPPGSGPTSEAGWAASVSGSDTCGPAQAFSLLVSRVDHCGDTYVATYEFWARDQCGNESARQQRAYTVIDTIPPVLAPPADLTVECPAPTSGPLSEAAWLASATATDTCGDATVLTRLVDSVDGCGNTFTHVLELWAVDECGNESARVLARYEVIDTTPPVFAVPGPEQFRTSIWPPNHGYVVYQTADVVSVSDACGSVTVRATGCRSSQPEEVHQGRTDDGGNGDGRTHEDCVVSVDGSQFAVRAERLGACGKDSMRVYGVEFTATDECGNTAPGVGSLIVEHDRSGHQDVRRGRKLGPNDPPPFPYLHPTVYGPGCE